ncbi:hypothetical protein RvY_02512 [Ramazzottius varieornatus]|uniref:PGAP2-interacting protein n=1 Tax=Ramazzottius varieornatus TaxID=947166 RepID=A0A1D1UJY0_RAMVA|nr:hypothetical protein RvY_02512 [Ramazzottius varieornatus]
MWLLDTSHDIVSYYCFWSLFYGLGPMIWFYPLNELAITGYEVFVAVWLIPLITAVSPLRRCVQSTVGTVLTEGGMLAGIVSFQAPTTWWRLAILAGGNAAAMLYLCAKLFSGSERTRTGQMWLLMSTNYLLLASRVITKSIAPAWLDHRTNIAVASVLAGSTCAKVFLAVSSRPEKERVLDGNARIDYSTEKAKETTRPQDPTSYPILRQLGHGISFGSVLYLLHWVFGELGVLSRWTVSGGPHSGPTPFFSSPLVLSALLMGTCVPVYFKRFSRSLLCWFLGTAAFFGTYYLDAWPGFACGLCLAGFASVLWTNALDRVPFGHPAVILGSAMLVYLVEIFFHVWTVAYNFVPGGIYTREHSDYLIGFMCLTFLPLFGKTSRNAIFSRPKSIKWIFQAALITAIIGTILRAPLQPRSGKSLDPSIRSFSALIWTYHFGYDNKGWPSLQRSADLLKKTDADIIALLESDASKPYLGHNDLGMWLSENLNMYVDFGPATKDHTWGNLLLSKYPIVSSTHHLLPSPHGELAPAISATLNISGNLVDVISTHMGNDRDVLDREMQTKYLARLSAYSKNPVVFLGYVTSAPGSRDYNYFTKQGMLRDIDPTDKNRWCEYIFYRKLVREGYARISHGGLSDTELQMARFTIPKNLSDYKDNDQYETDSAQVEQWKRFPVDFGQYTKGHYYPWEHNYHMSTPKYFVTKKSPS